MANERIKEAAKIAGVPLWMIAESAFNGMTDSSFSRKLRHQFSAEDEARAMAAIERIRMERRKDDDQREARL